MSAQAELARIDGEIRGALAGFRSREGWVTTDEVLEHLCTAYPNGGVQTVLPKIVAIDRLYGANLLRYLPKPAPGQEDWRPGRYVVLAREIAKLRLDKRFGAVEAVAPGLSLDVLPMIATMHRDVAEAAARASGRASDTFASNYLHFCRPAYFPIFDPAAERHALALMERKALDGKYLILGRFGFDHLAPDVSRYERFCRAVLSLQAALDDEGLGRYTLREMDKYLVMYG
jgi:hypothetical protein